MNHTVEEQQTRATEPVESPVESVDVAILGGGVAGMTLALELHRKRPDTSIVVIERREHPVPEATHKVGESTVEVASRYLRDVLGLGEHLRNEQLPKLGLRMFFSGNGNRDITRRVELGSSAWPPRNGIRTYQIDRGRLENALGRELRDRGVPFIPGGKVLSMELRPDEERHGLTFDGGDGTPRRIDARWMVDATGRSSLLKRQLDLTSDVEHHANAVWFRIGHPIDVDEWSDDPDWHDRIEDGARRFSTNHLMGLGYWVWLIPLASGSTSVGIVTDPTIHRFDGMNRFDRALAWLEEHEPQCAAAVSEHRDKLMDFRVMKDYAYSAKQVFSEDRWCLTGEAGVFLDPFYSPGLDFIAISNGLITDIVSRALDGEDVAERTAIHNQIFMLLTNNWFQVYEGKYPIMGNSRVMVAKVIWDTAVYWALAGFLYFQDKFRELADFPQSVVQLAWYDAFSRKTHQFFRDWDAADASGDESGDQDRFVRLYDFDVMRRLHVGMLDEIDASAFDERFTANVRLIAQLAGQAVATVLQEFEGDSANEAMRAQAERWRADDELMSLVKIHEEDRHSNPIDDGWITANRTGSTESADSAGVRG